MGRKTVNVLTLEKVSHAYLGRTIIDQTDLEISAGEVVALVGPSGCGKTTLAHIAAGIITPLRGRIARNYVRHAMVFQEPRLLPWATARSNIEYSLRLLGGDRKTRREHVLAAAARVALEPDDLDKYPVELSGGMKQRTAIARALAIEPDFIFFDEPFNGLDVALKRRMQDLIIEAAGETRFAALFITHDIMEAARVAHRIVVMDRHGLGIAGERKIKSNPGQRDDQTLFEIANDLLTKDPLFKHVNDIDERAYPV